MLNGISLTSQTSPQKFYLYFLTWELKRPAESGYKAREVGCSPHTYPAAGLLHCFGGKNGLGSIVMH